MVQLMHLPDRYLELILFKFISRTNLFFSFVLFYLKTLMHRFILIDNIPGIRSKVGKLHVFPKRDSKHTVSMYIVWLGLPLMIVNSGLLLLRMRALIRVWKLYEKSNKKWMRKVKAVLWYILLEQFRCKKTTWHDNYCANFIVQKVR